MTASEIKTFFQMLVDDDALSDAKLELLMNRAKADVESWRAWEFLKKLDNSQTRAVGDTYNTAYTMPSDFSRPMTRNQVFVGDARQALHQINFEQKEAFRDTSGYFFYDIVANKLHITGNASQADTINHFYLYATTDLSISTNNSPVWPSDYHALIPFRMAEFFFPIDRVEASRAFDARWGAEYRALKEKMILWDANLKASALHGSTMPYSTALEPKQLPY